MHEQDLAGQLLGHYRILHKLASGGTATVYVAMDLHLRRQVAIKVFRLQAEQDGQFPRWFAREAQVLANLDHPHILQVHDYGEQEGFAYLVMPFMTQGSLRDRLQSHQPLPIAEALHLTTQILQALQYAHERGLIHRDIKPGNLLFKTDGTLVLSDFGLVKILSRESDLTFPLQAATAAPDMPSHSTLAYAGTPHYMAPEQIQGRAIAQSDLYSVGIMLYELLTGNRPFGAENLLGLYIKHLTEPPRPPCELNPQIPQELEAIVLHALEKDPQQRYQNASDFLLALQANSDSESTRNVLPAQASATSAALYPGPAQSSRNDDTPVISTSPPSSKKSHLSSVPRRQVILMLLVLLVISASVGTVAYAYNHSHTPQTSTTGPASTHPSSQPVALSMLQTSCPAPGIARPAELNVTPPLVHGNHQNLVYQANSGLERYDVTDNQNTSIAQLPGANISSLQISADGQWIFFVIEDADGYKIQLVRMDGKALQTLYCSSDMITSLLWSPNEDRAIFNVFTSQGNDINGQATLYLLDAVSGKLSSLTQTSVATAFRPLSWFKSQRNMIYLTNYSSEDVLTTGELYLFNTDTKQPPTVIFRETIGCPDYTLSSDNSHLFISDCGADVPPGGARLPGSIQVTANLTDTSALQTIYSGPLAITHIAMISNTALLLEMQNNKGLWKINTDSSGLTQLTSTGQLTNFGISTGNVVSMNNGYNNQDTWANISRDGKFYSVLLQNASGKSLAYGKLNGGQPKTISTIGTSIGWTTL